MELKENGFDDKVVMGQPKAIGGITFIPVLSINFGCFDTLGTCFWGSISPIAFIVIDEENKGVSFYKIADDVEPHEIMNKIWGNYKDN
ncbi:MAG: hypothetical protein PWQ97_984 [Tepidanaerobacteraceae bacterium]|nr:hypothetical protein [Tepidanaerobacteraceae bacterium]